MNDSVTADSADTVHPEGSQAASPADASGTAEAASAAPSRPAVSLATQRLRFAVAMSGGVSLAVWMGGVAREVNLLTQASDLRIRADGEVPVPPPAAPQDGSLALRVRDLYGQLLDLVDVTASVDVLSGTSAGGVNAAVLGLANARRLDVGPLRDLWLQAGAFDELLRDPQADPNPPSLLKGDGQLLAALRDGLGKLTAGGAGPDEKNPARETTVHITTTLMHGQNGRFTDDYGNSVVDADNHGLFTFTTDQLAAPAAVGALALAARSSASFPAAFEPSFVPIGENVGQFEPKGMQGWHPDMSGYAENITQSAWVADGGLLANRPIDPLLRSVTARTTDREVRRVMLFVVPTSGSVTPAPKAVFANPYTLGESLRLDLDAMLNQSIGADLDTIRRHNDQVTSLASTRMLLARLAGSGPLADEQTWADYRNVETAAVVAPIAEEVTARMPCVAPWQPLLDTGGRASARIRAALDTTMEGRLPVPPQNLTDVMALGLPAYASARAAVLDLVYAGYQLAQNPDDVKAIAAAHKQLNAFSMRPADLTETVLGALRAMAGDESVAKGNWDAALSELATHLLDQMQAGITAVPANPAAPAPAGAVPGQDALDPAWNAMLKALASLSVITKKLADGEQPPAGPDPLPPSTAAVTRKTTPQSSADHRLGLAALINDYLTFLHLPYPDQENGTPAGAPGRLALRLAELHAAVRSTSPIGAEAEQRLELIQASADTRTLLAPNRPSASKKLTGLQLHHFAAFYKGTWRANDWMWGRLDGAGWLVQVLLDPRRIMAVIDAQRASDATLEGQAWFYEKLLGIAGEPGPEARALGITEQSLRADLAFLDDPTQPVPASLPNVALWVALPLQRYIAAEELTAVAGQIRNPANGSPHGPALGWLQQYDAALTGKPPGNVAGDILDPASICQRLAEAKVPPRKRIDTFLGGLEALLGKAPAGVRTELSFLQKAEPVIPPALDALQSWAGEQLAAAARQGPLRPAFGEAWVSRVAATLSTCPIADETLSGEIGTPLFTRTVTQALAVATEAGTATSGKPPATLAPAISTARTVTTAAYLVTKGTGGGAKALIWLGLLAFGVGIASMFVTIPIVGTAGLIVLFTGAILLGVGLWRRSLYVAGLVIALAIALIAAAPWLPYLHRYLFSWLARTALPFMDHHAWVWTALFLLVLMPPLWMLAGEFSRRRIRLKAAQQMAAATPVNAVVQPVAGGAGQNGTTGNGHGPAVSTPAAGSEAQPAVDNMDHLGAS